MSNGETEKIPLWNSSEINSNDVTKKQILDYLQKNASPEFLVKSKLSGKAISKAASMKKGDLVKVYEKYCSENNYEYFVNEWPSDEEEELEKEGLVKVHPKESGETQHSPIIKKDENKIDELREEAQLEEQKEKHQSNGTKENGAKENGVKETKVQEEKPKVQEQPKKQEEKPKVQEQPKKQEEKPKVQEQPKKQDSSKNHSFSQYTSSFPKPVVLVLNVIVFFFLLYVQFLKYVDSYLPGHPIQKTLTFTSKTVILVVHNVKLLFFGIFPAIANQSVNK